MDAEYTEYVSWDEQYSDLSLSDPINTEIIVQPGEISDPTFTIDRPAQLHGIVVEGGSTLRIEAQPGCDFFDPTLLFKDAQEAGIFIRDGTVEMVPQPYPTSEGGQMWQDMIQERSMIVIRNDFEIYERSIKRPRNKWYFLPGGLDWSLHNNHLLEMYNTQPMITYWEELEGPGGDSATVQRAIKFNYGLSGMEREKEVEMHKNTMDGGNKTKLTYDRTEEQKWILEGVLERRFEGKQKLKRLNYLSDTLQRYSPILLTTSEMIRYIKITNVDHEVKDTFYKFKMEVEEQGAPSTEKIDYEAQAVE